LLQNLCRLRSHRSLQNKSMWIEQIMKLNNFFYNFHVRCKSFIKPDIIPPITCNLKYNYSIYVLVLCHINFVLFYQVAVPVMTNFMGCKMKTFIETTLQTF
jgi:hypothetical protein